MIYPHNVLYGGKLYKAGEEVPEPKTEQASSSVSVKAEAVKEEKKPTKKRATNK